MRYSNYQLRADDLTFPTYVKADGTLKQLIDIANTYGRATLLDFKEILKVDVCYNDMKYYWTVSMLKHTNIIRVTDGWIINLIDPIITRGDDADDNKPKPVYILVGDDISYGIHEILDSLQDFVNGIPDREVFITIGADIPK